VFGRDPNWGRIACSVGYSGIQFDANRLDISLGVIPLMKNGQPLPFDRLEKILLHSQSMFRRFGHCK
jgi:glutamate N-acetyltransferase/amino-acid N-acetyltransferase